MNEMMSISVEQQNTCDAYYLASLAIFTVGGFVSRSRFIPVAAVLAILLSFFAQYILYRIPLPAGQAYRQTLLRVGSRARDDRLLLAVSHRWAVRMTNDCYWPLVADG